IPADLDSVSLHRAVLSHIDRALDALSGGVPVGERLHETRRQIKRLRALIRLAPQPVRSVERGRLKRLNPTLSTFRDLEAGRIALDALRAERAPLSPKHAALRTRLNRRIHAQAVERDRALFRVSFELRSLRERVKDWPAQGARRRLSKVTRKLSRRLQ